MKHKCCLRRDAVISYEKKGPFFPKKGKTESKRTGQTERKDNKRLWNIQPVIRTWRSRDSNENVSHKCKKRLMYIVIRWSSDILFIAFLRVENKRSSHWSANFPFKNKIVKIILSFKTVTVTHNPIILKVAHCLSLLFNNWTPTPLKQVSLKKR